MIDLPIVTENPANTGFACNAYVAIPGWQLRVGDGPIIATAIHDGHRIRDSLQPYLAIDDADRRREEDPLTGLFSSVVDTSLRVRSSRFECDVNRPRDKAVSTNPEDTWGLRIWQDNLPETEIAKSLADYDRFYAEAAILLEQLIERHGSLLLLDIHSYNHRRDGATSPPSSQQDNPDIDLGVTTLDAKRWGEVADAFAGILAESKVDDRQPDVRSNVRYPTGGYFPEWVYARYGTAICTISIEYKKIFMDEWTGQADIAITDDLRTGLERAVAGVRPAFGGR